LLDQRCGAIPHATLSAIASVILLLAIQDDISIPLRIVTMALEVAGEDRRRLRQMRCFLVRRNFTPLRPAFALRRSGAHIGSIGMRTQISSVLVAARRLRVQRAENSATAGFIRQLTPYILLTIRQAKCVQPVSSPALNDNFNSEAPSTNRHRRLWVDLAL
jgi:hypothetical protein